MAARMELRVEWKRREEESEAAESGEWWWKLLEVVHRYYRTYVMFICIVQICLSTWSGNGELHVAMTRGD